MDEFHKLQLNKKNLTMKNCAVVVYMTGIVMLVIEWLVSGYPEIKPYVYLSTLAISVLWYKIRNLAIMFAIAGWSVIALMFWFFENH
jgi:hypothetical protein